MAKISGFAKFDVDTKVTKNQFFHLLEHLSMETETEEAAKSRIADSMAMSKVLTPPGGGTPEKDPAQKTGSDFNPESVEAAPQTDRLKFFNEELYN